MGKTLYQHCILQHLWLSHSILTTMFNFQLSLWQTSNILPFVDYEKTYSINAKLKHYLELINCWIKPWEILKTFWNGNFSMKITAGSNLTLSSCLRPEHEIYEQNSKKSGCVCYSNNRMTQWKCSVLRWWIKCMICNYLIWDYDSNLLGSINRKLHGY